MTHRAPSLASLVLAACTNTPLPANLALVCGAGAADSGTIADVEAGNAAFATSLFQTLSDGGVGNLVVSPYSVSTALDLAYAGAATSSATQLAQVLGLGAAAGAPGTAVAAVACEAETDGSQGGNELLVANAMFGEKNLALEPAFVATLKSDYGAPLQTVDFEANAGAALSTINSWVSEQTDSLIPKLLSSSDVTSGTRLVLVNALYFKGSWESGFEPSQTQNLPFNVTSSSQVTAAMMNQAGKGEFGYLAGNRFSIAELPYKGGKVALDIILPTAIDGLAALTAGLTSAELQDWFGQLQQTQLEIELPRFTIDTHEELATPLQSMGLVAPFDPNQADFSGIDGAHDLYLQAVVHEALIEVDETGTTAAAATGIGVATLSAVAQPPSFIADHPFLFVLRDLGTGTFLFVGQLRDPTAG